MVSKSPRFCKDNKLLYYLQNVHSMFCQMFNWHHFFILRWFTIISVGLYCNLSWLRVSHLQHVLDGVDGGVQQGGDPLVIVGVVGVPQTHEENESRQTWEQIHRHTSGFELCGWMSKSLVSMEYKLQQINSVSICLTLLSSMNWWKQNYASIHICICRVSVDSNACVDHLWWVSWTVCSRLLSCTPACPGNPSLCERYWLCVRSRQPCSLERTAPYEHLLPPAKYY